MKKVLLDITMDGVGHGAYLGVELYNNGKFDVLASIAIDEEVDEPQNLGKFVFPNAEVVRYNLSVGDVLLWTDGEVTIDDISSYQMMNAAFAMLNNGKLI